MTLLKTFILPFLIFLFACATPQQNRQEPSPAQLSSSSPSQPNPPPEGCEFDDTQKIEFLVIQDKSDKEIEDLVREGTDEAMWEYFRGLCTTVIGRSPEDLKPEERKLKELCGKNELPLLPQFKDLLDTQIRAHINGLIKTRDRGKACGLKVDPSILKKKNPTTASDDNMGVG